MTGIMLRRLVVTLAAAAPRARALSHRERFPAMNLTASHLARKMARRDKRHRRSGRPVVQHDIQKTRFVKNMQRRRPACEATAEGCTPEEMERWAGIS